MYFDFYNVTTIHGLASMLNVVCKNSILLWLFPTAYKWYPVRIIFFIPTTLKNEQHPHKRVRFYEYGALETSTDVTNLPVDGLKSPCKILVVMHHG